MWVQKDTLRTKQERNSVFFLFLVQRIHDQAVDSLQFLLIFDGTQNTLTVFFLDGFQDLDLVILFFISGRNQNRTYQTWDYLL